MREILFVFGSFNDMATHVESCGDEQEVDLRPEHGELGLHGNEWMLATFAVAGEAVSVAACAVDRGEGLRLAFEPRDWQTLWQFANSDGPPSAPPPSMAAPVSDAVPPPDTLALVIDDDSATQRVVSEILQASGLVTDTAFSAEEAFDRIRERVPDLVVVDWNLPGMSGLDFTRRLRRDRSTLRVPVIFLTSNSTSDHLVQAFDAGADDFVSKPFRAPELGARVMGLLRRTRLAPMP